MEKVKKEYEVYPFEELAPDVQKKVVDENREINVDYYWDEVTHWNQTDRLKEYGFIDPKILYSGFWSQGDGACFTGKLDSDGLLTFLTKTEQLTKYPKLVKAIKGDEIYVNIQITHTDRYYHENSTTIDDSTEMQDNGELPEALRKEYDEWYASFDARGPRNESIGWYYEQCRIIYNELRDEYESRTDDDAVIENIVENELRFLKDGNEFTE